MAVPEGPNFIGLLRGIYKLIYPNLNRRNNHPAPSAP
jgi:hypothetical protein